MSASYKFTMTKDLLDPAIPILKFGDDPKSLEELKNKYSEYDPSYVTNTCYEPRRVILSETYEICKDYLDPNFTQDIKIPGRFLDKLWELFLCIVLLDNGYKLEKNPGGKKARPDFCILLPDNKKIWIEAVCPDLGDDERNSVEPFPDMIPGVFYSHGGNIADSLRPRILRVSSVLDKKHKKRDSYIKSGTMKDDEPYIIAVNTHRINHHSPEDMIEEGVLYGMGLMQINFKSGGGSRQFTPSQTKKTEDGHKNIPSEVFLLPEYKNLSAVIFSRIWFNFDSNYRNVLSSSIYTYFNYGATNPISSKDIKFGEKLIFEIKGNEGKLISYNN